MVRIAGPYSSCDWLTVSKFWSGVVVVANNLFYDQTSKLLEEERVCRLVYKATTDYVKWRGKSPYYQQSFSDGNKLNNPSWKGTDDYCAICVIFLLNFLLHCPSISCEWIFNAGDKRADIALVMHSFIICRSQREGGQVTAFSCLWDW